MAVTRLAALLLLSTFLSLSAAPQASARAPGGKPTILIARAVEASSMGAVANAWFSALVDSYWHLRLQPVEGVDVVAVDRLAPVVPGFANFGKAAPSGALVSAAQKIGATHIFTHNYEIDMKTMGVYYYVEIISVANNAMLMSFEKNFPLADLGKNLDDCAGQLLAKLKVTVPAEVSKVLKAGLLSSDPKSLQQLGITIFESQEAAPAKAAGTFAKFIERDPRMALTYWEAAQRYSAANDYASAARTLDNMIVQCNLGYPALYAAASAAYRQSNALDRALTILNRADKEGWQTLGLLLERAQLLEKTGKGAEAQQAYARVLAVDPNQPDALLLVARRSRQDGNFAKTVELADRLVKLGKNVGAAYVEKGLALAAQKRNDEALAALQEAVKQAPNNPEVQVALGDIYTARKEYAKAAAAYEIALAGMPNNLDVLLNVSHAYAAAGKPQDALAVLTRNEAHFYTTKVVSREMGLLEYQMRDTVNARKHLEASTAITPPDGRVFQFLGDIYMAANDPRAVDMYLKAEELMEDKLPARAALAKLYLARKENEKAVLYLQKVTAARPDYPKVNRMLGDVLFQKNAFEQALTAYLNERKVSGNDSYLQLQVALCYYKTESWANAGLALKKVVELDPKNADALYYLALISLRQNDFNGARSYIAQAELLGKSDPAVYVALAKGYTAAGAFDKAGESYLADLKAEPKNEASWLGLADCYLRAKKDTLAADAYAKAWELNPDKNKALLAQAGHIYYKAGSKKSAARVYQLFIGKGYKDAQVSYNMAQMAFADKRYDEVIALLVPVENDLAAEKQVLVMLAQAYRETKKTTEALMYAKKLVARDPNDAAAVEMAATSHEQSGDIKTATTYYQKYLSLPKTDKTQEYAFHLAELYEQSKLPAAALEQYKKNVQLFPADIRNYAKLGDILINMRDYAEAARVLAPAVNKQGAPLKLRRYLAEAYLNLGKPADAAASYEMYVASAPDDSTAWYQLGSIYFTQKNYNKAASPLTRAAVLMPKNTEAQYRLGVSLYNVKKLTEAVDPLSKALAAKPTDLELLTYLTECYRAAKDTVDLIGVLQRRVAVEPANFDISTELGNLLIARGELDKAITALEAASRAKPTEVGLHISLASLYAKKNDPKMQMLHLNAALSYQPNNADVTFAKAQLLLASNNVDEAQTALDRAIQLDPKNVKAMALYGGILKVQKKYREAYEQYNNALKYEPANTDYMMEMAQCAHLTGKNSLALKVAMKALETSPTNSKVLMWAGFFNLKDNNEDKAEGLLLQALQYDKNCSMCAENLGSIYLSRGDYAKATGYLEQAARSSERNDNVMVMLARALMLSGQADRAQELCSKALVINPQNDEALYLQVVVYIERGMVVQAEGQLARNRGDRTSGWIYLAQARIQEAHGDLPSALSSYKLAERVLPANADMYMGLGRAYIAQKKFQEAIEAYGMASGLEPSNPKIFLGMGKAYLGQKDLSSAKEYFSEAARLQPSDWEVHYMMAQVFAKQNEHLDAITACKNGLKYNENNVKLYLLLGDEYAAASQFEDAVSSYEKVARIDNGMAAEAYRLIGDVYFKNLKNYKSAKKYYERHVEVGGQNPEVKANLQKVENMQQ